MKYIVITAKHHDGFSMFDTAVSDFNIMKATPFRRDILKELAEACKKEDIKLGFYYSHVREWRHPMAQSYEAQGRPDRWGNYGNFWDYPNENLKNLDNYIDEFDIPQLKELLTNYGDLLTIWFDTPSQIRPDQAERIKKAVRKYQPACLINSRLSYDTEVDYASMGDNEIPIAGSDAPWETAMTTMGAWGYKKDAVFGKWEDMLDRLVDIASKGGNFLLNVGPDAEGVIPEPAQKELRKIGQWLAVNGKAVYGTERSPFPVVPEWGRVTRKGKKLYLIVRKVARISGDRHIKKLSDSYSEACRKLGKHLHKG
jgi:alpha-L-fucosidase